MISGIVILEKSSLNRKEMFHNGINVIDQNDTVLSG